MKSILHNILCLAIFGLSLSAAPLENSFENKKSSALEQKAYDIGLSAYLFFYPLILMELTRLQSIETRAPMNQFFHSAQTPAAKDKLVVRLNVDVLYSMAWVDIGKEPIIFTVPEMKDHSYVFQMLDAWSDVFANPGTRVTGSNAASFALVPPCFQESLPDGIQKIECPTSLVWIIGRIGLNGKSDAPNIQKLQPGFTLTPLSLWIKKEKAPTTKTALSYDLKAPVDQIDTMDFETYFETAMKLLSTTRVHSNDWPLITELTSLGITAGGSLKTIDATIIAGLKRGAQKAISLLKSDLLNLAQKTVNGWYMDTRIGTYGTDYFTRALVAKIGLGALLPQDTVYPSTYVDGDGKKLNGKNNYKIHFEHDELPPVKAFWSITLYNEESFFADNILHRYALKSDDPLRYNKDGSLDLYIQHKKPAKNKLNNWLPAPKENFTLSARLAWPDEKVLYGEWHMPAVVRS
ncbi:MAG: putative transmembrane protein [candidate division TM6 bacterium GW2011_GWE2_42_60]|nr:MAG: putative transmembrane protein [candidate division TM6 bacterium GW2011_GWE2_42_60]HBY05920.1 hypothetical protein [Candidatus Dependentiae bacterium]